MRHLALALFALAACATPPDGQLHTEAYAPDRIIVGFAGERPDRELDAGFVRLHALQLHDELGVGVYQVPSGHDVPNLVRELRAQSSWAFVEPDYAVAADVLGSQPDPFRPYQWNLDLLEVERTWVHSTGQGVVVAVLDTGVSAGPMDGLGRLMPGWDFVDRDADPSDEHGHGTHIAGTIAQATGNGLGVAGMAPDADLLPIRVLDEQGVGWTSDLVLGIERAVEEGADVINMSLGSEERSRSLSEAVSRACDTGVIMVASSGNDSVDAPRFPASLPCVISVGAVDADLERAWYSNGGVTLDVVAPGGDNEADANGDGVADGIVQETFWGDAWGYYLYQGTSMAVPHVSATAALLVGAGATGEEAVALIEQTALDLGEAGWDGDTGHGLVQPLAALEAMAWEKDLDAPVISAVRIRRLDGGGHAVVFDTDEPTYGSACTLDLGTCLESAEGLSTEHAVALDSLPGDEMFLLAEDPEGNLAQAGPYAIP